MNNLKRVLALGLAGTMLSGMMMVGAGAANAENFTDASEIANKEAVSTMVSLNIIDGKDDGSFAPDEIVTRAQMAKMLTIARNGGKDPVLGTKATPTFTDIKGHWAEKYIEYCASLGIINGRGDGTFAPDAPVTGSEAAKMMLTAMDYDSTVFKFTGIDWAINVNTEANTAGLYEALDHVNPDEGMTRDDAAQLIYNGVLAPAMQKSPSLEITDGKITYQYTPGPSLFVSKYEGEDKDGIMTGYSYDDAKDEWTYNVTGAASLPTGDDYTDLFGMNVRVLYKVVNGKTTVYGIFAKDSTVMAEGYAGDVSNTVAADTSVKISGTSYKLDDDASDVRVVNNNRYSTVLGDLTSVKDTDTGYSFKLIDNDNNGKADLLVKTPFTVAKVSYVGTSSITVDNGIGAKDFDDIDIYDDVAKDDYVLYTAPAYSNKEMHTFAKLELTEGDISGKKSGSQFLVDGDWMTNISGTSMDVNDTISYIGLGKNIYYAKVTSAETGSRALGMVFNVGFTANDGVNSQKLQAKMIFSDGAKSTVTIAKINGVTVTYDASMNDVTTDSFGGSAMTAVNGDSITDGTIQALLVGELVNYKVNNDGEYEVKVLTDGTAYAAPTNSDILGYDGVTVPAVYDYSDNTVDSKELAPDATVFVYVGADHTADSSNKAFVYSGKEIKNTGKDYGTASFTTYGNAVYGKTSGFTYAQVVALGHTAKPDITTGANYGYLVSDAYTSYDRDAKKDYINFNYWNGTENVKAKAEGTDITGFTAGAIITFDVDSADIIKNVTVPLTLTTGKVTGWDGVKKISLDSNRELSDDTVILYIDSDKKEGREGDISIIAEAANVDGIAGTEDNVRYVVSGSKDVALLVVDVNNNMKAAPAMYVSTVDAANSLLANTANVTLQGSLVAGDWAKLDKFVAGKTLTVTGNAAAPAGAYTVPAGATLKVNGTLTLTANAFTVNGTLEVGTIADANIAQLAMGAAGKLVYNTTPTPAVMGQLEAITSGTIVLNSNATAAANSKWYTAIGTADTDGAAGTTNGTAATAVGAGSTVPAGTYVYGTFGYSGADTVTTPNVAGWFLQAE